MHLKITSPVASCLRSKTFVIYPGPLDSSCLTEKSKGKDTNWNLLSRVLISVLNLIVFQHRVTYHDENYPIHPPQLTNLMCSFQTVRYIYCCCRDTSTVCQGVREQDGKCEQRQSTNELNRTETRPLQTLKRYQQISTFDTHTHKKTTQPLLISCLCVRCTSKSSCTNYSLSVSPKLSTRPAPAFIVALSLMAEYSSDCHCVAHLPRYPPSSGWLGIIAPTVQEPLSRQVSRALLSVPFRSFVTNLHAHVPTWEYRANNGLQFVVKFLCRWRFRQFQGKIILGNLKKTAQ